MIKSSKIDIIVAVAVVFALVTSFALVAIGNVQAEKGVFKTEPEYASRIFGADIISIEIIADEDEWQEMLDNAIREQFIRADVIVNGKKFNNVGIRPKGNSSLTQVARSNSDRYSFRLQFDEYVKGQTCFGLQSFVINNMLGDNTYMKEYISYDMMREVGVDAPYFGFADVKVNGKNWGLYLAVELYNDSYEQRVFGDTLGMLYNVKSMDMGANDNANQPGGQGMNPPFMPDMRNAMPQIQPGGQPRQSQGLQQNTRNNRNNTGDRPDTDWPVTPPDGISSASPYPPSGSGDAASPGQNPPAPNTPGQNPFLRNPAAQIPQPQNPQPQIPQPQNPQPQNPRPQFPQPQIPQPQFPQAQIDGGNRGMDRNFGARGGWGSNGGSLEYTDDNTSSYRAIFSNVVGKGTESDFQRVVKALKALSEGRDLETYFDVDKILRYLAAHTFVVNLDSYSSIMAQNYYIYERNGKITILPWDYNLAWGGFQGGNASSVVNFPIDTPVSGVDMSRRPLIDKLLSNKEYLERYHGYLQHLVDNYFANGKFEEKIKALDALISDYVKNDATAFCTYDEYKKAVSTFITLGNLRAQSVQGQLDGSIPSTTAGQNANPSKLVSAGNLNLSDLGRMGGGRGNNMGFPGGIGGWQFGGGQQDSGQFDGAQQDNGQSDETQQGGGRLGGIPQEGGQFGGIPQGGRQFGSMPQEGGQFSRMPQGGGQFDGSPQAGGQWAFPGNFGGGARQGNQNNNAFAPFNVTLPAYRGTRNDGLILMGVLSMVLIGAILFAARYKKSY